MKKIIFIFILLTSLSNCNDLNKHNQKKDIKVSGKEIKIHFFKSRSLNEKKYIIIDNNKYIFSHDLDSIYRMENILPANYLIVKRKDSSFIIEKNSHILISSVLYEKLKQTKKYNIKNLPELLTTGVLKIERKDGKKITVETNCQNIVEKIK